MVCPGGLVGLVLWPRMALTLIALALMALSLMALALEASALVVFGLGIGSRGLGAHSLSDPDRVGLSHGSLGHSDLDLFLCPWPWPCGPWPWLLWPGRPGEQSRLLG